MLLILYYTHTFNCPSPLLDCEFLQGRLLTSFCPDAHEKCGPYSQLSVGVERASLVAQTGKNLPVMPETRVPSLGWEDPLEEGLATHSSILAWRIPMDRGAWQANSPWGHIESDTTGATYHARTQMNLRSFNQFQALPKYTPSIIRSHVPPW